MPGQAIHGWLQEAKATRGRKLHNDSVGLCGPNIRQARAQGDAWIKHCPGSSEPEVDKAPILVSKALWLDRGTSSSVNRDPCLAKEYQIEIQLQSKGIHATKTHYSLLCLHCSGVTQAVKSLMERTRESGCHFSGCVALLFYPKMTGNRMGGVKDCRHLADYLV